MKKDNYLEDGEIEARKCKNYDSNCYCIDGKTCYVFGDKIRKVDECNNYKKEFGGKK